MGYANVRIVGGSDRVAEFEKLTGTYNGKLYNFDNIEVRLLVIVMLILMMYLVCPHQNKERQQQRMILKVS